MKKIFATLLISSLVFSACKKDHDDNNNNDLNTTDRDFAVKAWQANSFELDGAQLALTRSSNSDIMDFAQMMITDHTSAKAGLQTIANDLNIALPDTLDNEDTGVRAQLIDIGPSFFDSTYIHAQVAAHQKAISIFQAEINGGKNERLKNYATEQLPHLQTHLQEAENIALNY